MTDIFGRAQSVEELDAGFKRLASIMKADLTRRGLMGRRKASEVRGHSEPGRNLRKIAIGFDADIFDEIERRAKAADTSFAEQVRLLVEWGLEAEDGD